MITLKWRKDGDKDLFATSKGGIVSEYYIVKDAGFCLVVWSVDGITLFEWTFKTLKSAQKVAELMENG